MFTRLGGFKKRKYKNYQKGVCKEEEGHVLNEQINRYNDLPSSMKDARGWLRERAVDWLKWGDDDTAEWHESKSWDFLDYADFY